jgi:hypothetical protein
MSMILNVEILGDYKRLTSATKGATGELHTLSGKVSGFSSLAKSAFSSIGVGLSFAAVAREIGQATQAAIEDRKSQELLATSLRNTVGASDALIASVEGQITQWSYAKGIADDELRPAYSKLALATGDVEEANKLMSIALDASAGSGKSLDSVAQAMAKSVNGTDTALIKLLPSLKGSKTPIDDLATAFAGASDAAAKSDPYAHLQVIFGELEEQIGQKFLPVADDLAAYFSSADGKQAIDDFATTIGILGDHFADSTKQTGEFTKLVNGELKKIGLSKGMNDILDWVLTVSSMGSPLAIAGESISNIIRVMNGKWQDVTFGGNNIVNATRRTVATPTANSSLTVNFNNSGTTITGSDVNSVLARWGKQNGTY